MKLCDEMMLYDLDEAELDQQTARAQSVRMSLEAIVVQFSSRRD